MMAEKEQTEILRRNLSDYYNEQNESFSKSPLTTQHILFGLDNLNNANFSKLLNERWDDPSVFRGIKNIFASLASLHSLMTAPQIYRHYINILKVLGSGVQGTVSAGNLISGSPNLAVKNVAESEDIISLVREFLVGWQLNKLATKTPVFSHMYSTIKCSKVLVAKEKEPITFCARGNSFSNISQFIPGVEVGSSDKKITVSDFNKTFLLLLFGLKEASVLNYTHNDLHVSNVFYRKLPNKWNFKIEWKGKTYWILTDIIPVVLDYGLSRIDTPHGPIYPTGPDWIKYLKITEKVVPLQDVYKFIMWSFTVFQSIQSEIRWMIEYFHPTLSQKQFDNLIDSRFTLEGAFRDQSIDSYIDYFMKKVPKEILMQRAEPNKHIYANYSSSVNFYETIGIDISRYSGLKDTYQWYLFKKFKGKDGGKELVVIIPKEMNSLLKLVKSFSEELKRWKDNITRITRKEQILILGKIGDRILVILEESSTLNFALDYIKDKYEKEISELNGLITDIKKDLLPFMEIYKRLLDLSKKERRLNMNEASLSSDLSAIHPPEYHF